MAAATAIDTDTIVKVLTTPGVQDDEIRPAADEATIREYLATPVDPDATAFGVPFGSVLYVRMNTTGARVLAEAGVDVHAYESEEDLDLTVGEGNLYGQMSLIGGPAFAVQSAHAVQGSALFDVLATCHALDKQIGTNADGAVSVLAIFDC
ncbi:hypothetical protein DVS28_b0054 (plasmid) [Euzebya pacifica]|uniref:Uncharacterized protein n=1 Tax=Euzebya pacifica TaxID=1608957 RepID=A0A346Y5S7_9ACTN|nr:hypothetical protein [Euzebya pacifica]AXV09824.1 hypothetical protein DVS28_b0054 [Euzebya pacifica]